MTSPKFMLDTNIVSDMIRNPNGQAARRARQNYAHLCVSIIVASELRYGYIKKGSATLRRKVEDILSEIEILSFDVPADSEYGTLRCELESIGQPIGANDLLIAAHARSLNLTLVTANTAEFARVRGLTIENWLH